MRTRDENKELNLREKAIEMIVKSGFDGLSMQKLAKAAGVSPATIYIYFKDREDLIIQLYLEESKKMADASLKGFDPDMHFDEGLRIQWLNRAQYCLRNPLQMHFLEQIRYSPMQEKLQGIADKTLQNAMRTFVGNAIRRNEIKKVPVEVFWSVAYAPLYNLMKFHMGGKNMAGDKFQLDDKTLMQALQLVLKALKP